MKDIQAADFPVNHSIFLLIIAYMPQVNCSCAWYKRTCLKPTSYSSHPEMDINFNKSTNITWKPDNTLEVASSNGHVSKITGVSFANYLLVKDNPKLLKLIEKRAVSL